MKYVIFSDIHGNMDSMQTFSRSILEFPKDRIVCLGDIVHRGKTFDENRVVDMLREMQVVCVKGNHEEELDYNGNLKIQPANLEFLLNLDSTIQIGNIVAYHSSKSTSGKRLRTKEDLLGEARYLNDHHPDITLALFGHSHEPCAFAYEPKKDKGNFTPLASHVPLEPNHVYLLNPGGLGIRHSPNTFMILDTDQNKLDFYTLE